jgi:hypothetical protein
MSLFGFNQERQVRMPSTRQGQGQGQGEVRVKKRHSNRPKPDSGRQGDDVIEEKGVHKLVDTVIKEPVNLPFPVAVQTKGSEDVLGRITTLQEVVDRLERKFDDLVRQFQRRAEEDGVVLSAQKDVIEQWKTVSR